jgi:hypothetical protein
MFSKNKGLFFIIFCLSATSMDAADRSSQQGEFFFSEAVPVVGGKSEGKKPAKRKARALSVNLDPECPNEKSVCLEQCSQSDVIERVNFAINEYRKNPEKHKTLLIRAYSEFYNNLEFQKIKDLKKLFKKIKSNKNLHKVWRDFYNNRPIYFTFSDKDIEQSKKNQIIIKFINETHSSLQELLQEIEKNPDQKQKKLEDFVIKIKPLWNSHCSNEINVSPETEEKIKKIYKVLDRFLQQSIIL